MAYKRKNNNKNQKKAKDDVPLKTLMILSFRSSSTLESCLLSVDKDSGINQRALMTVCHSSDEGLTLETSASSSFYGNLLLINWLDTNFSHFSSLQGTTDSLKNEAFISLIVRSLN